MTSQDQNDLEKYYHQHQEITKALSKETNYLEHLCTLDIDQEPYSVRHSGIICTIGKPNFEMDFINAKNKYDILFWSKKKVRLVEMFLKWWK